jgi:hypothetical protein
LIARIAAFEGGNAEEMGRRNNEMLFGRGVTELPPGILRVMVHHDLTSDGELLAVLDSFRVRFLAPPA